MNPDSTNLRRQWMSHTPQLLVVQTRGTVLWRTAGGSFPKNPKRSTHIGKVNGRRIIGASHKSLFRTFFRFPRTCLACPPDETWGDRVAGEFIPAGRLSSFRRCAVSRPGSSPG